MHEKIALIGDIHGKNRNPLGRLQDYNDDLFNKLQWIVNYCNKNKIETIIHLGDIHDKTEATDEWKNRFIQIIRQFKGLFYTIIGNHDLPNNNEKLYYQTCLRNLELAGAAFILRDPIQVGKAKIIPLSLDIQKAKKELQSYAEQAKETNETWIFVGHHYYQFDLKPEAGFVEDDFRQFKSSMNLVLGHDHRQHESIFVNRCCNLFRPGSMMRTELSEETITMRPRFLVYDSSKTLEPWTYIEIPHRDINEIYDVAMYRNKKNNTKYFKQTRNALDNMDKYLKTQEVSIPCSKALKKLNCPSEEYEYLRYVYQSCSQEF